MINLPYKDKLFSILGDSISTFEGVSTPEDAVYYDVGRKLESDVITTSNTWWGRVIEESCGRLLVNNSIASSTVIRHPLYEIPSYGCSDERTSSLNANNLSPDVIMVFLGTNDWGMWARIYDETEKGENLAVFSVAYDRMLKKLAKNYPAAEIWCLSLIRASREGVITQALHNGGGYLASDYCAAISDIANANGCKFFDLYNGVTVQTIDGYHPNANGMKTIADVILSKALS